MKRYLLTRSAGHDLVMIYEYIAQDSPSAAGRMVRDIRKAFLRLAARPGIGHAREEFAGLPILAYSIKSYVILYRADTKPLQIIRVVHGARDLTPLDLS